MSRNEQCNEQDSRGSTWSRGGHCKVTMNMHEVRGQRWICLIQILVKIRGFIRSKVRGQKAGNDVRAITSLQRSDVDTLLTTKESCWDIFTVTSDVTSLEGCDVMLQRGHGEYAWGQMSMLGQCVTSERSSKIENDVRPNVWGKF